MAQAAKDHAHRIAATFTDVVNDADASDRQRMHASKTLIAIEGRESELQRADEREGLARHTDIPEDRDELIQQLAAKLIANPIVAARLSAVLASAAVPGDDPPQIS